MAGTTERLKNVSRALFKGFERETKVNVGKPRREVKLYQPTEVEAELLYEMNLRYSPGSLEHAYTHLHRTWVTNIAYYYGYQNLHFDAHGRPYSQSRPSWGEFYSANKVFRRILRAHTRLAAEPMRQRVTPNSAERDDVLAARMADRLVEHLRYISGFDEEREDALLWAVICGSGFVKFSWNPKAMKRIHEDQNGKIKEEDLGELEADAVPSFSVRVPPYIYRQKKLPWWASIQTLPMEYIYQNFPEKADYVSPMEQTAEETFFENMLSGLSITGLSNWDQASEAGSEFARVCEMYAAPCERFPKGFHLIESNGVILHGNKENPYAEMGCHIPVVKYDYARALGRYMGVGLAEQLVPVQRELNRTRTQIVKNKDLISNPKWTAPRGHGLPNTALNDRPGEVIEFNPGLPRPEPVSMPELPSYVLDHVKTLNEEMAEVSAQSEVSQGQGSGSLRSGAAIEMMQAADQSSEGTIRLQLRRSDAEAATIMLKVAKVKYDEKRVVATLDESDQWDVKLISGLDLKGHTQVRVFAERGLLQSVAARRQMLMDLVELGVINAQDPAEKRSLLRALELNDIDHIARRLLADERKAETENAIMLKPPMAGAFTIPPVAEYDQHEVHLQIHDDMRKDTRYLTLELEHRSAIDQHVALHAEALAAQQQAMMEQTLARRGGPGEKGQASQPKKSGGQSQGGSQGGEKDGAEAGK